jgi:hypothetical protein
MVIPLRRLIHSQSLGASMIHDHDQLSLAVTADGSSVKADISVSLGLIVTERVINTLKDAFPEERSGKILVDYRSHGEDWKRSVSDDGVGTPEKMADAKRGLGTSIVEALANQLDATVETRAGIPAPSFRSLTRAQKMRTAQLRRHRRRRRSDRQTIPRSLQVDNGVCFVGPLLTARTLKNAAQPQRAIFGRRTASSPFPIADLLVARWCRIVCRHREGCSGGER